MTLEVHVGEQAQVVVALRDAQGNLTNTYDKVIGISWTLTHPASMTLVDEDAEPRDAVLTFTDLTPPGEEAFVDVSLDGDPGDGVREINLRSIEGITVVPGEAVTGEVHVIRMAPV